MTAPPRAPRQLGSALIVAGTAVIIALMWFGALSAVTAHRSAWHAEVATRIQSKADLLAGELRRELLASDQSLHILELDWERDPAAFDIRNESQRVLALTDLSLQIFLADAQGIVRQSSRPEIIGDNISGRDYFRYHAGSRRDEQRLFIGSLTRGMTTGLWQINFARRLDHKDGSFGGVIAASYDVNEFYRLGQTLDLGPGGLLVIAAPDGSVRGVGNPNLLASTLSIGGSPVFAAMRHAQRGVWSGKSPLDGVDRIMGFATVPGYGLRTLVGLDRGQALRLADHWELDAFAFTGAATLVVLVMAGIILWADQIARARHWAVLREKAELAKANLQLAAAESGERAKAMQLEATLAGMSDGIMMMDADMRLLAWNARFPEFTGVPAEILKVGLAMEDILRAQARVGEFGEVDVEAEVRRRLMLLKMGASTGTIERRRPNGRFLEVRRNPLPGGGFVTLYSDITSRRDAEDRARRAETMAAIGRLTAGIAHDFNNLLATISGNGEMVRQSLVSGSRELRRVSMILQAADRGAELVRQLLAFARKQELTPQPVDLNQTLRGISELLRSTVGAKVAVDMQLEPDLWLALIDPVQIEHVILNLVINSRDAMPEGGLLTITTTNFSLRPPERTEDLAPGDYVTIAVRDTGTGMTEEVLRNAYDPFFTTKPPGRGSGLGLSQVYGVARQSGGSVRIESKLGEGSTVRVFLPRASPSAEKAGKAVADSCA